MTLNGDGRDDPLSGANGNNVLNGGADNDTLNGGTGIDDLYGDEGDDTLWFETTADVTAGEEIFGGADTDRILVSGGNSDVFDFRRTLIGEVGTIEFDALSATARTVQLDG